MLFSKKNILFIPVILLLLFSGCETSDDEESAVYDIRGTWTYAQYYAEGEVYDAGTIVFSGDTEEGNYTGMDYYGNSFSGTYTVEGLDVHIAGSKVLTGEFNDNNNMEGTWLLEGDPEAWEAWR